MNSETWKRAFSQSVSELKDMRTYQSLLQESRHHQFKEMIIHHMYGTFSCPNCKSKRWVLILTESLEITISAFSIFLRSWSSTSCNTEIKYRYNPTLKRGEVLISREFSQDCQRCNTSIKPKFDDEACEKAVEKILTRIKRVFYNQAPTSNEFSERHSGAQMRENPHDSSR